MRSSPIFVLAACLLLAADKNEKASDDDKDLATALHKAAAVESYAFKVADKSGKAVEGTFQKDQPILYQADKILFYKKGDVLVYKQGDEWKRSKTGIESDPLLILAASANVRAARLPHEELATLAKNLKEAKKEDKKDAGLTVYAADLAEEGAKKLAPTESQGVAKSGQAKIWVDKEGAVVKYTISIRLQGRQGNAEVNGTAEKTVTLSELGKAKIELPEGAKKALE
jgi:hypothetical protein